MRQMLTRGLIELGSVMNGNTLHMTWSVWCG